MIQGNIEGQPGFCLVIAVAVHKASFDERLERWRPYIKHWVYVDDWTIQVPMAGSNVLMDVVVERLKQYNMNVKHSKCAFHVPAFQNAAMESWPAEADALAQRIPHRSGGLTLLGTSPENLPVRRTCCSIVCNHRVA